MECKVKADQGSDANFQSKQLLNKIQKEAPNVLVVPFDTEQIYRRITGDPCLKSDRKVTLDVFLRVRHGRALS